MRIVRFIDERGGVRYGTEYEDGAATLLRGDPFDRPQPSDERVGVGRLLCPIEPRAILCIGLNYRQHAEETGAQLPEFPVLFMKNPAAAHHPGEPIVIPPVCRDPEQVDYEVELAVVIGRAARDVSRSDALGFVLGYTAGNDVSARHWQKHGGGGQWNRGKSFDTFCPLGPELVTAQDIPDPQALRVRTVLNGRVMQDSTTTDMIFPVAELIEFLSQGTTLLPGTVIMTGTPSGVGFSRQPPVFLRDGDEVTVEVEGIGKLTNPVRAG